MRQPAMALAPVRVAAGQMNRIRRPPAPSRARR
jgi:hypothetical protein